MKKIKLIGFIAIILLFQSVAAQEARVPHRIIFTELGSISHGGIPLTINFDRRFNANDHLGFGYRVGAGVLGIPGSAGPDQDGNFPPNTLFLFPVGINYVFGNLDSRHTFEVGVNAVFYSDVFLAGALSLMWRRLPLGNRGFTFHAGLTPSAASAFGGIPSLTMLLLVYSTIGVGFAF